jgi:hypothetical protein
MFGTSVPKTPVNEDGDPCSSERQIGTAPSPRQALIDTEAQSELVDGRAEGQLAWRISSAGGLHTSAYDGR